MVITIIKLDIITKVVFLKAFVLQKVPLTIFALNQATLHQNQLFKFFINFIHDLSADLHILKYLKYDLLKLIQEEHTQS